MFKRGLVSIVVLVATLSGAFAQTGTWSGKLDVQGTPLTIVFHLDDDNPTADSPDQGVKGIPIQIERTGFGIISIRIPSLGATFQGAGIGNQIVGTFTQMNLPFPLTLTPGENKPLRPQTPQGPFPYSEEEVSFTNGDIVLNGTLVLPEGSSADTPALIMVTGSGIQNRDEELLDHKPFAVMADAFARAGIATLRYDDRGYGGNGAEAALWTVEDFRKDALAGIELLRTRFRKVGVIGHSEGGTIAFMLAAGQEVDFMISLAGMAVSGAETLVSQNRTALVQAGAPEETVETYCGMIQKAFDAAVQGNPMPKIDNVDLPEGLKQNFVAVLGQIRTPYMSHFLSMDMRPLLGKITCPVLALNGTKDMQVDCEANIQAIANGLPINEKNKIVSIEGVNHLFQHCTTGHVSEYRTIEETIAPEVIETMVLWLEGIKYF